MHKEQQPKFKVLPLGAVKPKGWILEQLKRDLEEGFAGRLDQLTDHAANDLFKNRIDTSANSFAWWDSETRGNWLWGYVMMAYLADHPEHKARVGSILADLKKTQDKDGYIGIYSPSDRYRHASGENGELWGQSRALLTMLAYYELTGDSSYLEAVERAVKLTMQHYGPGRKRYFNPEGTEEFIHLMGLTHGLCFVDVAEWLYDITGNEHYRDFGVWLYKDFNNVPEHFPNDDIKLGNLLQPIPFAGHAVHTAEHLRVLFWAYLMTGNPDMKRAVETAVAKTAHYSVASGALIGDESIHGLPVPDVGYEYCTITELLLSLSSALQKFGDISYADWVENLVFNAAQGARFANGSSIAYLSTENRLEATASRPDPYSYFNVTGRFKYSPTHDDVACCCNPNAVRLMPHYVSRMWMRLNEESGLVAVNYGPCTLVTEINGVSVVVEQITEYPFEETVTLRISPAQDVAFSLLLRKPGWSSNANISVDDAEVREQEGYFVVEKTWRQGDSITLSLSARIETVLNPNGECAVHRGPLQYALPFEHIMSAIRDYPVPEFHDYDVIPKDISEAYQTLFLDQTLADFGLVFERRISANRLRPWDDPPVQLRSAEFALAPIGSTVLRRATFPIKGSRLESD